jgi:hypothetical protein
VLNTINQPNNEKIKYLVWYCLIYCNTITTTAAPGREYYKEEVESDIKKGTFLTTENSK